MIDREKLLQQLLDGTLTACACLGAVDGQPFCPCTMDRLKREELLKSTTNHELDKLTGMPLFTCDMCDRES